MVLLYATYISVDLAHNEIIGAKVGKVHLKSSHDMCRCQMASQILQHLTSLQLVTGTVWRR